MYQTYEPQSPSLGDRFASLTDALFANPLVGTLVFVGGAFVLLLGLVMIASLFEKVSDPYAGLAEKSLPARAAIATSLLSACLPRQLTGREKPARVTYQIDPSGNCLVSLQTAGGDPMTLPGKLLAIVARIISP